ncbi:hypothetical protein [Calothrix sp. 336/3]
MLIFPVGNQGKVFCRQTMSGEINFGDRGGNERIGATFKKQQ